MTDPAPTVAQSPPPGLANDPLPAAEVWWRALTPEVRGVWLELVTGWTMKRAMAAAYARAAGEAKP